MKKPTTKKGKMAKMSKVMKEFKAGKLHSGKKGPVVKNPKQAVAIAYSEAGKKGGKSVSSQNWQCTKTGYTSTAGGLTCYQNNRGIDTSNRIKIDGTKSWQITFECGKVIVTSETLKTWTAENGYSYDGVIKVRGGQLSNHRGIVKVICF